MNQLRRISLLLSVVLATVVARMIIDGLTLLSALTAALVLALLVGSLRLKQLGRRVRPGTRRNTDLSRSSGARQR